MMICIRHTATEPHDRVGGGKGGKGGKGGRLLLRFGFGLGRFAAVCSGN